MHTTSIEQRDDLTQLEALGYTPAPMIPGGDGAVGWVTSDGGAREFAEFLPAQARAHQPAGATAESGIVAGNGIVIVRIAGDNSSAMRLPWTPLLWGNADGGFAVYRAPAKPLSAEREFGPSRSFGWTFTNDGQGFTILERDVAVKLPAGLAVPPIANLPIFGVDDLDNLFDDLLRDGCRSYDIRVPHDPVRSWEIVRGAHLRGKRVHGEFADDVMIPAGCPDDPDREAIQAEHAAMRAEALDELAWSARALAEAGTQADAARALAHPLWNLDEARRERLRDQVAELAIKAGARPAEVPAAAASAAHPAYSAPALLPFKLEMITDESGLMDSVLPPSLYGNVFNRGEVFITGALPGVGKTTLMIDEAVCLASGLSLLGVPVNEPCNVLLLNLEDRVERIKQRVRAFCELASVMPSHFKGTLHVAGAVEIGGALIIGGEERGSFKINESALLNLRRMVEAHRIDVVMIDPLVSMHQGNENASGAMDGILKALARMSMELNFAVHINHHVGKLPRGATAVTLHDLRGSSAILGAIRGGRVINWTSEDERERAMDAGQTAEEVKRLVRVSYEKVSYGEPPSAEYYAIKGHDVVAPGMMFPPLYRSSGMVRVKLAKSTRLTNDEVVRVHTGMVPHWSRKSPKSPQWVGIRVGALLDLDMGDKSNKKRVEFIVSDLIRRGVLKVVEGQKANREKTEDVVANSDWKSPANALQSAYSDDEEVGG
ncbi:MAG: helicase RepA family protein [Proteobacteria bacterium]|nr:helicase RepA family protein [Pseudomonadota bacterium]